MKKSASDEITLRNGDLGILCICALRYAMGRQTYISELIRGVVKPFLQHLPDADIDVMLRDCDEQACYNCYGDVRIDRPGWIAWRETLQEEKMRRSENGGANDGEL